MITGMQIRAARAALHLSISELAEIAGVGVQTIMRFENASGIPPSRSSTIMDVQKALEFAGIEFIGTPDDAPGIRLRRQPVD